MRITAVHRINGGLLLETPVTESAEFFDKFKPGDYDICKARKARSNNANAYCWVICEKIGKKLRSTKEEVYRNAVRQVGVFDPMVIRNTAVNKFAEHWSERGIGWFCETVDSQDEEHTMLNVYYGSSTYDTAQMSRLIDNLVQDAKELGIETEPEEYIKSLLESWNEK